MFVSLWLRPEGAACYPHDLQPFTRVKDIDLKIRSCSRVSVLLF
jgi:hypothetical protein